MDIQGRHDAHARLHEMNLTVCFCCSNQVSLLQTQHETSLCRVVSLDVQLDGHVCWSRATVIYSSDDQEYKVLL